MKSLRILVFAVLFLKKIVLYTLGKVTHDSSSKSVRVRFGRNLKHLLMAHVYAECFV